MMNTGKPTLKQSLKGWVYLAPMLIILGIFSIYPIISSLAMSFFTDYNFFTNEVHALGFDNFTYIFQDPEFWQSVKNTFIFVFGVVPVEIVLSLTIAIILMRIEKFTKLFRTIYFLPFVTSIVAISMVWAWIYNTDSGLLNYFLGFFGIHPINWLNDPKYSLLSLIILAIWKGLGFNIILFLVALNNVDKQFYKAAEVDGANHWQQLLHITLPLISPTTFLVTVNATIGNFKVFDEVFALFGGQPGPAKSAMTMVFYLYRQFYVRNQYGIAAAVGVVLLLIILVFTLLQQRVSRNMVHY